MEYGIEPVLSLVICNHVCNYILCPGLPIFS